MPFGEDVVHAKAQRKRVGEDVRVVAKCREGVKTTTLAAGLFHFCCDTSNLPQSLPRLIYVWIFDKSERVSALAVGAR